MAQNDDLTAADDRAARLAAALRDNLKRRKAQARAVVPPRAGPGEGRDDT